MSSECDVLSERSGIGATVLSSFMAREKALVNATGMTHLTQTTLKSFFPVALRPNAGHGLLFLEVSRSHTTTRHSR